MGGMRISIPWSRYRPCPACGSATGAPCLVLNARREVASTRRPMNWPHVGRRLLARSDGMPRRGRLPDREREEERLQVWRRGAMIGTRVADIAAQLGMSRAALDQCVQRARRRGHPDAIVHLWAVPGAPVVHPAARRRC